MKKQIITALVLSGIFLSGCNLDLIPENGLTTSNAFLTEKELNATTTSILLKVEFAMSDFTFYTVGERYDENGSQESLREWNPQSVVSQPSKWKEYYDIILLSNFLMENIDTTKGMSTDRYNYHKGQALFAKGFAYLNLAMRYGDAIVTKDSKTYLPYPTVGVLQVLDEVIKAGEEGYKILPVYEDLRGLNNSAVPNKQVASKGACAALLAHAYAWKGSMIKLLGLEGNAEEAYQKSIYYASEIINGKAGNYSLLSDPAELTERMSSTAEPSPEDIFVVAFDQLSSEYSVSPSMAVEFMSWPVNDLSLLGDLTSTTTMRMHKSTALEMFPDEEDMRRQAYFYEFDQAHEVNGIDYALMYKYHKALYHVDEFSESGKSFRSLDAHYNYWRLADIILLRAECYAKLMRDGEAISDLNKIRKRAGAKLYPAAQDTKGVQYAVFKERERELLFESDHRYFDVIRNGYSYIKTELQGKFAVLTKQEIKDGAVFLPVPSSAFGVGGRNTLVRQKNYWIRYTE